MWCDRNSSKLTGTSGPCVCGFGLPLSVWVWVAVRVKPPGQLLLQSMCMSLSEAMVFVATSATHCWYGGCRHSHSHPSSVSISTDCVVFIAMKQNDHAKSRRRFLSWPLKFGRIKVKRKVGLNLDVGLGVIWRWD